MKATHIVVIASGWVFVGTMGSTTGPKSRSGITQLTDAACVRKWGTTRGLGELALGGPLKETVLDPCGTVDIATPSVYFSIPVEQSKWR